jgi:peptide/nickel transport system permease protein
MAVTIPIAHETETVERARRLSGPLAGVTLIAVALALFALVGPLLAPHGATQILPPPAGPLKAPASAYPFGTDINGMDVLSRVLWAARLDIGIAFIAALITFTVGFPIGIVLGYYGGWKTNIALRILDMIQAFPVLVIALATVALLGGGALVVILTAAFLGIPVMVRIVRSVVVSTRRERFVEAAVASGSTDLRILRRHIAPHVLGTGLIQATTTMSSTLILVTGLSFIGVGVQPPKAEWGAMIQQGSQGIVNGEWWVVVFPGLAVALSILAINTMGELLQRATGGRS